MIHSPVKTRLAILLAGLSTSKKCDKNRKKEGQEKRDRKQEEEIKPK
jgi:hypothetical protein